MQTLVVKNIGDSFFNRNEQRRLESRLGAEPSSTKGIGRVWVRYRWLFILSTDGMFLESFAFDETPMSSLGWGPFQSPVVDLCFLTKHPLGFIIALRDGTVIPTEYDLTTRNWRTSASQTLSLLQQKARIVVCAVAIHDAHRSFWWCERLDEVDGQWDWTVKWTSYTIPSKVSLLDIKLESRTKNVIGCSPSMDLLATEKAIVIYPTGIAPPGLYCWWMPSTGKFKACSILERAEKFCFESSRAVSSFRQLCVESMGTWANDHIPKDSRVLKVFRWQDHHLIVTTSNEVCIVDDSKILHRFELGTENTYSEITTNGFALFCITHNLVDVYDLPSGRRLCSENLPNSPDGCWKFCTSSNNSRTVSACCNDAIVSLQLYTENTLATNLPVLTRWESGNIGFTLAPSGTRLRLGVSAPPPPQPVSCSPVLPLVFLHQSLEEKEGHSQTTIARNEVQVTSRRLDESLREELLQTTYARKLNSTCTRYQCLCQTPSEADHVS